MDFLTKLEALMTIRGIKNLKELSKHADVPYTTLRGFYDKGTDNIKLSTLNKLKDYFGCTLDYLADDSVIDPDFGREEKTDALIIDTEPDKTIAGKLIKLTLPNKYKVEGVIDNYALSEQTGLYVVRPEMPCVKMKIYNEPAAAGIGDYLSDYSDNNYDIEEFPENDIPCKASFGVRISGDSMEPDIANGSVVWVKEQAAIENNQIGIFVLNGESYCKKLHIDYENRIVELVSLNPKYKNIVVKEDDNLRTVGRVLL
jgi:DNA-binding Xre family transcriptional regulator